MTDPPFLPKKRQHHLRLPAHDVEFLLRVQLAVPGGEIGLAFQQEAPAVGAHGDAEDVVRVPGPEGDEDAGVEGEGRVKGGRVVEAEVGAVPVDYSRAGGGGGRRRNDGSGGARHGFFVGGD